MKRQELRTPHPTPRRLTSILDEPVTCGVCNATVRAGDAEYVEPAFVDLGGYWMCDTCEAKE